MSDQQYYTVVSGDTLYSIAQKFSQNTPLSVQQIEQANPGIDPHFLHIGQKIVIPTSSAHIDSLVLSPEAEHMGYWDWTWSHSACPSNATLSLAFSGWADPSQAINDSQRKLGQLVGQRYCTIGGGNQNGKFTQLNVAALTECVQGGKFSGYEGIALDVECGDAGLSSSFAALFNVAKAAGLKVLVTVSHCSPFGVPDHSALMRSFLDNDNIDIISPQLYTTGKEAQNDFALTAGTIKWSDYANAKAAIVPSIVKAHYYDDAKAYFEKQGVTLAGYIQWKQT